MPIRCTAILFLLLLMATGLFAQKYTVSNTKAIKSYENALTAINSRNNELGLALLDEALKREPNFAEAYLLKFELYAEEGELNQAAEALRNAVAINPDFFPNAWFFLGTLELKSGNYAEARKNLNKFKSYRGVQPDMVARAVEIIATCDFAEKAMQNPVPFEPINMGAAINSEDPEYYPCLTADGRVLLYTRLRKDPEAFKGRNEDFFVSRMEGDEWQPSLPLREINTIYNEGAPTISADGRILVFTACDIMGDYGRGRMGFGSCDLFIAYRVGNSWSKAENMGEAINSRNWETQPSLSADGKTLYFVRGIATRQGVQNQDIYVSYDLGERGWSRPQALGPGVNTPGREESVMIHPDGRTLYFASDGHPGMGGMDLFVSRLDAEGNWQQAENLGYPINTHNDENSLHVGPDGNIALFASDRDGGFGGLDLYSFDLPTSVQPTAVTYAEGIVVDDNTGEPVAASLELFDIEKDVHSTRFNSDAETGTFLIALPTGQSYGLSVKADGYLFHSETFELNQPEANKPYALEVRLKKPVAGSAIVLRNVFFDTDQDVLKSQSTNELNQLASFLKANPDIRVEVSGHTDNQGGADYNKKLSERRAEAVKSHLVGVLGIDEARIEARGYGQEMPVASNDTQEGRALNRRTEFKVID